MTLPAGPDDATRCGALMGERYELADLLGTGGAGAVYRARDVVSGEDVAIKVLRSGPDEVAVARLRAEARIAGSLAHPGIARLLALGEEASPAGSVPYLVMEHVDGRTLRELLRGGERLGVDTVLRLLGQIAEALEAVHRAGIVHRDLKPANLMLTREGRAVLLDFGIARHHAEEPLTLTGTIVGTVEYISPEQAAGRSASSLSDLYALGMVAYECLTGLRPLSRDTQVSTLMAHATTPVPPLPPTVPAGVRELVAAMVALDPARRPASASVVAQRARALLADPTATHTFRAPVPARSRRPVEGALVRESRRRHLAAAACATLLALLTAGVLAHRAPVPVAAAADRASTSSVSASAPGIATSLVAPAVAQAAIAAPPPSTEARSAPKPRRNTTHHHHERHAAQRHHPHRGRH